MFLKQAYFFYMQICVVMGGHVLHRFMKLTWLKGKSIFIDLQNIHQFPKHSSRLPNRSHPSLQTQRSNKS